jgi:hypothetical protein
MHSSPCNAVNTTFRKPLLEYPNPEAAPPVNEEVVPREVMGLVEAKVDKKIMVEENKCCQEK